MLIASTRVVVRINCRTCANTVPVTNDATSVIALSRVTLTVIFHRCLIRLQIGTLVRINALELERPISFYGLEIKGRKCHVCSEARACSRVLPLRHGASRLIVSLARWRYYFQACLCEVTLYFRSHVPRGRALTSRSILYLELPVLFSLRFALALFLAPSRVMPREFERVNFRFASSSSVLPTRLCSIFPPHLSDVPSSDNFGRKREGAKVADDGWRKER